LEQSSSIGSAEASATVPAWTSGVRDIAAAGDVVKRRRGFRRVQHRIDIAYIFAERLINSREQACPQRRDGTRSTDDGRASIHDDVVASGL